MRNTALMVVAALSVLSMCASAQTSTAPLLEEVAKALGFTDQEVAQIKAGQIIKKDLKEGSKKELAGVVGTFFQQPVGELVEIAMQGKALETPGDKHAFHLWAPDTSADEAFADCALTASENAEAKIFAKAEPGGKLNLSTAEIASFRKARSTAESVNPLLRAMLKARYEAYRKSGLKGIASYARSGHNESSPSRELELAINETKPVAPRQDFFNALLSYPSGQLPDAEHRFYWSKSTVEGRPTFVLAHRVERRAPNAALMTEEQIYVSHSYNCNFVAGGALAVQGGTIVFYVNRTFTDRVAGFASGLRHNIGRGQMLDSVAAQLQHAREQFRK